MNDHELDRALAAAVNAEHSADFLARVRGRVTAEHPSAWPARWQLAFGGAALAAALVTAVVYWPAGEQAVPAPELAVSAGPAAPVIPSEPAIVATSAPTSTRSPIARVHHAPKAARRTPPAARFPEVLIAPQDARAIRLLAAISTESRIPAHLETDGVSTRSAVTLPRIEVPHVIVEPLAEIARLEGDRP